jgi:hypothetical protein
MYAELRCPGSLRRDERQPLEGAPQRRRRRANVLKEM